MKNKPEISIVIPTYERGEVLINTIKDSLNQSIKNIEVLVIDQTEQHQPEVAKKLSSISDSRFRYFLIRPPSVTAAKNFALSKARADIVLFLDDDVRFDSNLAKAHLQAYKKLPDISAVGGRVMQNGFPIMEDILRFDDIAVSRGVFTSPKGGYTNAFPGGNVSMKVKDALSVGGFDTRYYWNAFREESDMSIKMSKSGLKIYFEPKAELLHLATPSGGSRKHKYENIHDSPMFYRNEIFFTLRAAKFPIKALKYKYAEYCEDRSRRIKYRRTYYFYTGILAAIWRMIWNKQIVAKER